MSDELKKNQEEEELAVINEACDLEDEDLEDVAGGGCAPGSGCCGGSSQFDE